MSKWKLVEYLSIRLLYLTSAQSNRRGFTRLKIESMVQLGPTPEIIGIFCQSSTNVTLVMFMIFNSKKAFASEITLIYLGYSAVNIVGVFKRFFESEFPWTFLFILIMWESTIIWYKWYDISNHHLNHKIHYCYLYLGHQLHVISRIFSHYISRDLPVWLHLIMKFMQIILL